MHQKPQSYETQFLRYQVRRKGFFVILGHFLPFYPPNNPKNQNFEKMEKESRDIIILQICTKNHDHMLHLSWDMDCNRQNFLSLQVIFCPFTPLLTSKIKIWTNVKKNWRYYHLKNFRLVFRLRLNLEKRFNCLLKSVSLWPKTEFSYTNIFWVVAINECCCVK